MKETFKSPIKENNYIRLILPHPINDYPYKVKRLNHVIGVPRVCPLCGSREQLKRHKLRLRSYCRENYGTYLYHHYYLKILFCKKHSKEKNLILLYCFFFYLFAILPLILIGVFINNFFPEIIIIFTLIAPSFGFIYIIRNLVKLEYKITNHIFLEFCPPIGVIISVTNPDWAEEFRRYNKCIHIQGLIEDSLKNSEQLKRRFTIYYWISFLLMGMTGLLGLILAILITQRSLIISFFGLIIFGCSILYSDNFLSNLDSKRFQEYTDYLNKKTCYPKGEQLK